MTSITVASLTRSKSKRWNWLLSRPHLYPISLRRISTRISCSASRTLLGYDAPLCLFPTFSLFSPCLLLAFSLPALTQLLENMITTESPDEKQAQIAKVVGVFDADNDKKVGLAAFDSLLTLCHLPLNYLYHIRDPKHKRIERVPDVYAHPSGERS